MLEVWKMIGRASTSQAPVLITGESGVGKELVARAIHDYSLRRSGPFVAVNIAALPQALIESELFGHEKGAFTGATLKRTGRFELASNGSLFLDEIGDLDMNLQTKLLRVLEDGTFERLGDATPFRSQARILAATSRIVTPGAEGAALREDLYYRLGVVRIHVPPLRERTQDIPLIVDAFLRTFSGARRAISEEALERLLAYDWPGNVRQLRHVLENACVMSTTEILDAADFALADQPTNISADEPEEEAFASSNLNLRENLERLERRIIETALARAKGNRALAARLLGIRRALLYTRMKHFGLE
jgi:DNA-binding NtrC family response regulator